MTTTRDSTQAATGLQCLPQSSLPAAPNAFSNPSAPAPVAGQCDEKYFRQSFEDQAPQMSECAYFGRRALSWLRWIPGLSQNSYLDSANKEVSHEHIIFPSTGQNIGFGPHGLFAEDVASHGYKIDPTCYDGQTMRRAIAATDKPSFYGFVVNNCQSYVERVLSSYQKLLGK